MKKSLTGLPYIKVLNLIQNAVSAKKKIDRMYEILSLDFMKTDVVPIFDHFIKAAELAINGQGFTGEISQFLYNIPQGGKFINLGKRKYKINSPEDLAKYFCRKRL